METDNTVTEKEISEKRRVRNEIEAEIKQWKQALQLHEEESKNYLKAMKLKFKLLETKVLSDQKKLQKELNKLNLSKDFPFGDEMQIRFDKLKSFYDQLTIPQLAQMINTNMIEVSNPIRELFSECSIYQSQLKESNVDLQQKITESLKKSQTTPKESSGLKTRNSSRKRQEIEPSEEPETLLAKNVNNPALNDNAILNNQIDIDVTRSKLEECNARIQAEISKQKSLAFGQFWEVNQDLITKARATLLKEAPDATVVFKEMKQLELNYKKLRDMYKSDIESWKNEIEDSIESISKLQESVDKIVPNSIKKIDETSQKQLPKNGKVDELPDPKQDPDNFLRKMKDVLSSPDLGIDYNKLTTDDDLVRDSNGNLPEKQKCFKDPPVQTPYQKTVGYLLSPRSPKMGLFVFGGVGSGKTCMGLSAISETVNWFVENPFDQTRSRWAVVLLPQESLFKNWADDFKWCGKKLPNFQWNFNLRNLGVTTKLWYIDIPNGGFYVVMHKVSKKMPDELIRMWGGGMLPRNSLILVDEAQNIVETSKLSILKSAQAIALDFAQEMNNRDDLKKGLFTGTPLLDENKISDFFKLLNIVKLKKDKYSVQFEGGWRVPLTQTELGTAEGKKKKEKMNKEIDAERNYILNYFFDIKKGTWKDGMRVKFQKDNLGDLLFVRLENDISAYPQLNLNILPQFCENPNETCAIELVKQVGNNQWSFNKYIKGTHLLTESEQYSLDHKEYRKVRTIQIAVPLSKIASQKYSQYSTEILLRDSSKSNCREEDKEKDPRLCINWYDKSNPLAIGRGNSLKTYRKDGKEEIPPKAIALGLMLEKFPDQKHFALIPSKDFRDGPQSIVDYLKKNGYNVITLKSIQNILLDKIKNPNKDWKQYAMEWFKNNPPAKRMIYFGKLSNDDAEANVKEAFKEFVQVLFTWHEPTPEKVTQSARKTISNLDGKYIQLFLGDRTSAEGLNLLGVRHVHEMEPLAPAMKQQTIGRALRYCALKYFPRGERYVNVYTYVSEFDIDFQTKLDNKEAKKGATKKGSKKQKNAEVVQPQTVMPPLKTQLLTADQYVYNDENIFDPVDELYKAVAETGVDCLLLKDYNQLGTCFPDQIPEKRKKTGLETPNDDLSLNWVTSEKKNTSIKKPVTRYCVNPKTRDYLVQADIDNEFEILGFEYVPAFSQDQCLTLGYLLDDSKELTLQNMVVYMLLKQLGNQEGLDEFDRRKKFFPPEKSAPKVSGVLSKVKGYLGKIWEKWTKRSEEFSEEYQSKIEDDNYFISINGRDIVELTQLPLSKKEYETGIPFKYDKISYDLASRILTIDLKNPTLIEAFAKRINPDDASVLLSFLKYKMDQTPKDELESLEKEGKTFIYKNFTALLESQKLKTLRQKITSRKPKTLKQLSEQE
jgi:hypothetical protein